MPKSEINKKDWSSWEFNKKSDPEFQQVISSPFDYYFPKYVEATRVLIEKYKTRSKVFLLNLDKNRVSIEKEF